MLLQLLEAILQPLADHPGILLKPVFVDDVEHGKAGGHADRVAAEGVEVDALRERLRDLHPRRNGGEGNAVADTLRHSDKIRHDVEVLEAPIVIPGSTEARL